MILGIVGAEAAKFTPETEQQAKLEIQHLLDNLGAMDSVCSGECHLGGIDIWAHELADKAGISFIPYPPKILQWEGGYKQRNLQIAKASDKVVCIAVRTYPPNYDGMKFTTCYHHEPEEIVENHIKSGGCWTTKQAKRLGKETQLIVI